MRIFRIVPDHGGTIIIMIISAMGIFSLSLSMSMKRLKEFGIRKVLGATVTSIASLHLQYFLKIGVVSILIALPVSHIMMSQWLDQFAYRTTAGLALYATIGFFALLIALCSAAYAAINAAGRNPIELIED